MPALGDLLDEIAERARAVVALRERGVELQQRALQQPELRRHLAIRQDLEGALHDRERLVDIRGAAHGAGPRAAAADAATRDSQVFVGDELVAVLLHHEAGELPSADDEHLLVVLLQLFDEGDEVRVAADDDEGVDVVVGERHLERVEGEVDVGAVLVSTGRQVALHHANRMLRQLPAVVAGALPVAVGDLGHDLAAFLDGFEHDADVERRTEGGLHADLDVVEIDEDRDLQSGFCQWVVLRFGDGTPLSVRRRNARGGCGTKACRKRPSYRSAADVYRPDALELQTRGAKAPPPQVPGVGRAPRATLQQ